MAYIIGSRSGATTFNGDITMGAGTRILFDNLEGSAALPAIAWADAGGVYDTGIYQDATDELDFTMAGVVQFNMNAVSFVIQQGNNLAFDTATGAGDAFIEIDAANILAQRNSTNAQTFRLYETFTDASNNQGLSIDAGVTTANTVTITPFENGTGSDNQNLVLEAIGSAGEIHLRTGGDFIRFFDTIYDYIAFGGGANAGSSTNVTISVTNNLTRTTTTQQAFLFDATFAPASGTPKNQFFALQPIINWGGTPGAGSYEVHFINVTETAIPTGTNYLIRSQVDTFDIFRVSTRGAVSWGNYDEGGTAAWTVKSSRDSVTLTGATTDTTTISVPSGARLLAVLLNVDTTVVNDGDDTWAAAFITGSTSTVAAAGTAAAQNTKITLMLPDEVTTAITQIRFTPQGANFTAGVIEVVVYYEELTPMADA